MICGFCVTLFSLVCFVCIVEILVPRVSSLQSLTLGTSVLLCGLFEHLSQHIVGWCRRVGEQNAWRSRQWQIAITTTSATTHPVSTHIIWNRDSVHKAILSRVESGGVWMTWCWGRSGGVWWSSANGSMTIREGEEFSFFHQLISSCGCGGCIKRFLVLFEHTRLRMGLNGGMTSHDGCSVVFARVSSNILSEPIPPTNSNESGRSGGAYTSLGTRQERVEGLRMLA